MGDLADDTYREVERDEEVRSALALGCACRDARNWKPQNDDPMIWECSKCGSTCDPY